MTTGSVRTLGAGVSCALFAVCAGTAPVAQAQSVMESSVTLYGGYRVGGELTETITGSGASLADASSYALAVDIGIEPQKQVQLFYSRQKTELTSGGFSLTVNKLPLTMEYYHIGGTYFWEPASRGTGGYVVGGIGATVARPDFAGLSSETKPSINIGFGFMLPLGNSLGLRFEARGYATLLNNDGGFFCGSNTGCVVSISGTALYQGEALVGLSGRF